MSESENKPGLAGTTTGIPPRLAGEWLNTNSAARGITRIVLAVEGGELVMRAFGACEPSPCDWGEVATCFFAKERCYYESMAFTALYDFGFMESQLLAHVKLGVLVVAKFDRFKDGSGRSNYFSREFFYRMDG